MGGTGVVGLLENGAGPTLMLRCDLDALPVTEATGLPFASAVTAEAEDGGTVGVMHACGHDMHMTALTGTAQYLAAHQDRWAGTLLLVGQPAEETGAGAKAMLDDGLFARFPKPDFALALHVDPTTPAGTVSVTPGYALANVDSVDVTFRGRGGHGAQPHTALDPVVIGGGIYPQRPGDRRPRGRPPASRRSSPWGRSTPAASTTLFPTRRGCSSPSAATRTRCGSSYCPRSNAGPRAWRAPPGPPAPEVTSSEGTPALYNDDPLTARVRGLFAAALGEANVLEGEPSMGGGRFQPLRQGRRADPDDPPGVRRRPGSRPLRGGGRLPPEPAQRDLLPPPPSPTLRTGLTAPHRRRPGACCPRRSDPSPYQPGARDPAARAASGPSCRTRPPTPELAPRAGTGGRPTAPCEPAVRDGDRERRPGVTRGRAAAMMRRPSPNGASR